MEKKLKRVAEWCGFQVEVDEEVEVDANMRMVRHHAPTWPVLVDIMMKNIPIAERIYFEKESKKSLPLNLNAANIAALVGKVIFVVMLIKFSCWSSMGIFHMPSELKFLGSGQIQLQLLLSQYSMETLHWYFLI
jgi:hypothetical protein